MKKWISVLLSVAILFTSIPIQTVFAQELEDASISTDAAEDLGAVEDDSAGEENAVRQDCTANFQFIQEDGTFATENDVKVRVVNDCLMVDAFWIFQKLGLKFKIHKGEDEDLLPQRMGSYGNRYIKEMAAGYNAIFGDNSDGVEMEVHKENVDWSFYFQVGSSKMYSYSEYFGQVSTELGSEVECLDNGDGTLTYWIPLFMFLNIFDTVYVIADGTLRISPCPTTVTDIMHMSNLDDYDYDVIEDSGIGEMGYITALSFEKFYNTLKSLSQGVVTISWNTLSQAFPQNDENMEGFAKQLCIPDNIQAEKIQSHADIHSVVSGSAAAATDSFSQILGDAVTSEKNQAQTLTNRVNQIIQIPASSEEIAAANEKVQKLAEESELLEKYNQKFGTAFTALDSIFVVLFTYLSASNEINAASQKQIDALKMYMDSSETYEQLVLDDNARNAIQDKIEMYDGKNDNILTNPSVVDELINTVGDFWMSYDVNNVVVPTLLEGLLEEGVAEAASTILVDLQLISLGWDGAELIVNTVLGTFDTLDCVQLAMYAMGLEYDSQTVLKDYKNELKQSSIGEEEIEKYRKLEWVRLESYCLARENVLGIYEAEKNDHPEEYQTATEYDRGKEAELAEWMAVLLNGFKGFNRESLDEFAADCQTYNQALIDEMDVSYFVTGELMAADNELSEANIVLTNSDGEVVASDAIVESTTSKHLEFKVLRGTYNLSVIASGYETYSQSVTVERGNIGLGEIVLQPKKATVSVTVADSNGNPMEGVNVNFQLPVVVESVNHERNETTDAEGRINVKVPAASYTFTFTKDGYQTNTLETAVEADGDLGIVTLEQAIFDVKDYLYSMENLVAALGLTNTSTTEGDIYAKNDLLSISTDFIDISSYGDTPRWLVVNGFGNRNYGDNRVRLFDVGIGDFLENALEKIDNYGSIFWPNEDETYVGLVTKEGLTMDIRLSIDSNEMVTGFWVDCGCTTAGGFSVVRTAMESILELENTLDMASLPDWKRQYINIIKRNYSLGGWGVEEIEKYDIAYIDGDDIPELIMYFDGEYEYGERTDKYVRVYSYKNSSVQMYELDSVYFGFGLYGIDYLERENRILVETDTGSARGGLSQYIYTLGDTESFLLGEGALHDERDYSSLEEMRGITIYDWDGADVTEEEYNNNMNSVYGDRSSSKYIDLSDELESVQKILQH